MAVKFPELISEMAKRELTRIAVAKKLGITPRALYSKLTGKTDFTLSEANTIHSEFFPNIKMEVLFARSDTDSNRHGA